MDCKWLTEVWDYLAHLFSAAQAPWWSTPMLTFITTLLGATIAFTSTRASDKRKQEFDKETRWDKEVRDHCSAFLRSCDEAKDQANEYHRLAVKAASSSGPDTDTGANVDARDAAKKRAISQRDAAKDALIQLSFIAPQELHDAGFGLLASVIRLSGTASTDADEIKRCNDQFRQSRGAVLKQLRLSIKLKPHGEQKKKRLYRRPS